MMRSRAGLATACAVGLGAALLSVTALSGTAWASHKQTPILECVFHDTGTGKWYSLWGYNNSSGSVETDAIGSGNSFSPGAQSQGQPTSFQPGQHDNVFTVTWSGTGSLTWTLNGQSASATTSSKKCATNPVSIFPGTEGWGLALPVVILALATLGVGFYSRRSDIGLIGRRS